MQEALFHWKKSQATEFLSVVDAYIAFGLYTEISRENPQICEIGVWRGGWINSLCVNQVAGRIIGIDPYPGLEEIKKEFEENVMSLYPNVKLYSSLNQLLVGSPEVIFDMVHIDGEHSEVALLKDLESSSRILDEQGILIIDDIWHESFPGVASATFKFIHSSDFAPFLISGAKIYLCKESEHARYFESTKQILSKGNLTYQTSFQKGTYGEDYQQDNSIKGYEQIVTNGSRRNLENLLALTHPAPSRRIKFFKYAEKTVLLFVPPIIPRLLKFVPKFR
jgi:hypothetical protein